MDWPSLIDETRTTVLPGYTLRDNLILQPTFDEDGNVINPDLLVEPYRLCADCRRISFYTSSREIYRLQVESIPFERSHFTACQRISQGCHLCALLWASRIRKSKAIYEKDLCYSSLKSTTLIFSATKLTVVYSDYSTSDQFKLYSSAQGQVSDTTVQRKARLSVSNASNASFQLANSLLRECLVNHNDCRNTQSAITAPPTRLLHVGTTEQPKVKIVYAKEQVQYVAVSHCWGPVKPSLQLTRDSHEMFVQGIQQSELPQLFRDFVTATRQLGFQYAWIDTYCVMQDSKDDWKREASRMGDVYRGATCTLAAVSAPDSQSSLFTKLHPLTDEGYFTNDKTKAASICIHRNLFNCQDPLYERAWVMQERLLAPRTLGFTDTGIRFRCLETASNRWQPDFDPSSASWTKLVRTRASNLSRDQFGYLTKHWVNLLREYNSAKLTFESDRPFALQGIISTLEKETGLIFVEGICQNILPNSLLWSLLPPPGQWGQWDSAHDAKYGVPTPSTYKTWQSLLPCFPSWSCAYRKSWYAGNIGQAESTSARTDFLPGPLLRIEGNYHGPFWINSMGKSITVSGDWECYIDFETRDHTGMYHLESKICPQITTFLKFDVFLEEPVEAELVLLLQAEDVDWHGDKYGPFASAYGLILISMDPNSKLSQRIGTFQIHNHLGNKENELTHNDVLSSLFPNSKEYIVQ